MGESRYAAVPSTSKHPNADRNCKKDSEKDGDKELKDHTTKSREKENERRNERDTRSHGKLDGKKDSRRGTLDYYQNNDWWYNTKNDWVSDRSKSSWNIHDWIQDERYGGNAWKAKDEKNNSWKEADWVGKTNS